MLFAGGFCCACNLSIIKSVTEYIHTYPHRNDSTASCFLSHKSLFRYSLMGKTCYNIQAIRDVAQFGRAYRSGRWGRGFESRHPDHTKGHWFHTMRIETSVLFFYILDPVSMYLTLMTSEISLLHRRTSNLMKCACKYCGWQSDKLQFENHKLYQKHFHCNCK